MVGYDPQVRELPHIAYGAAGVLSGFLTRAITQPLDVIKIRLQLQDRPLKRLRDSKYHGMVHATRTIWKEEGLMAFWKGHNPAQVLSVVYGLVQFTSFELLTHQVWKVFPSKLTTDFKPVTHFVCGGLAGCAATLASQPFDVIRTRFVVQGEPKVYRSMLDATRQIIWKENASGLYRGLLPTLTQIAPQTGLQFSFYSVFSSAWHLLINHGETPQNGIGALGGLVCGSAAGLCAKVVVYPLDVIKKRLQIQGFEYGNAVVGSSQKYRGFIDCTRRVVRLEGLRALYNGLSPSLFKALVTTGLHFSTYEYSLLFVRRVYYVSRESK